MVTLMLPATGAGPTAIGTEMAITPATMRMEDTGRRTRAADGIKGIMGPGDGAEAQGTGAVDRGRDGHIDGDVFAVTAATAHRMSRSWLD